MSGFCRKFCRVVSLFTAILVTISLSSYYGCNAEEVSAPGVSFDALSQCYPTLAPVDPGTLSASAAVLMDAQSGQLLYAKEADTRLPMASTTKIMTALVAVTLADPAETVEIAPEAVGIEGSSVYLYAGEKLTLEQLLYALLLESANDAAVAIALHVSGSLSAFADEMNAKATELGLQNTHFTNPHGLDDENHYTTARELALIARAALQIPLLAKIFATRNITIPLKSDEGTRYLRNHNKLLKTYEGTIGLKTGFTRQSGRCLCSAATRDGLTLIAVTLHAPDDWEDHRKLLDAGFDAYEAVPLLSSAPTEQTFTVSVVGGCESTVSTAPATSLTMTLPKARGALLCTVNLPRFLYAPVTAGSAIGSLQFACDLNGDGKPEDIASVSLCTVSLVEKEQKNGFFRRFIHRLLGAEQT